jgi:hypothetical protein
LSFVRFPLRINVGPVPNIAILKSFSIFAPTLYPFIMKNAFLIILLISGSVVFAQNTKPAIVQKPVEEKSEKEKAREQQEEEKRMKEREGKEKFREAQREEEKKINDELREKREKREKRELEQEEKRKKKREEKRRKEVEKAQKKGNADRSVPKPIGSDK